MAASNLGSNWFAESFPFVSAAHSASTRISFSAALSANIKCFDLMAKYTDLGSDSVVPRRCSRFMMFSNVLRRAP